MSGKVFWREDKYTQRPEVGRSVAHLRKWEGLVQGAQRRSKRGS